MSHLRPYKKHDDRENETQKTTDSVLALASVLLEVSRLQDHDLDEWARGGLNVCEEILLERIAASADSAQSRARRSDKDT